MCEVTEQWKLGCRECWEKYDTEMGWAQKSDDKKKTEPSPDDAQKSKSSSQSGGYQATSSGSADPVAVGVPFLFDEDNDLKDIGLAMSGLLRLLEGSWGALGGFLRFLGRLRSLLTVLESYCVVLGGLLGDSWRALEPSEGSLEGLGRLLGGS